MKDFLVGMAKIDITPKLGTFLYGYPVNRPAERILDNICVSALAVRQNLKTVVFISAEIGDISTEKYELIANAVSETTGIKKENIIYAAIHTHSAPITRTSVGWGDEDTEYLNTVLIPGSIKAVKNAFKNMQPAKMAIGMSQSLAGINRREVTQDGKVILGQNPKGPYNPDMTAVVFKSPSGKNIGTIIHFACHPTSAGTNLSVTRDWPGYMIDKVEEITNAPCMYFNGAEGDIGPRLSNGKTTADESYIEEIGNIAAQDAQIAVKNAKDFVTPNLKVFSGKVTLPFTDMPSYEDIQADIEKMGDPDKLIEVDIIKYSRLSRLKEIYDTNAKVPSEMVINQTLVSLDELAFVPVPFEVFCNIGINLSKASPFEKTLTIGLAGGSLGYIPTEDQLKYGGYEVDSFRSVTIPGFTDSTDKQLVSENVRLLNEMYNK